MSHPYAISIRPILCVLFACACALAARPVRGDTPTTAPSPKESPLHWPTAGELKGDDQGDEQGDPIGSIADKMAGIVEDLTALQTNAPVQAKQREVLGDLDALIKELEKQCKGGGSGSNPNPTRPMTKSQIVGGPGGSGPLHDPNAGTRVWGQLPPKEREQILQSQTEGFPPGYESVLASYYNRLAQGQVATDAAAGAATTQPTHP